MNKNDVAEYLKVSIASVNRYMKEEKLPYMKLGNSVRFNKEEVDKYLQSKTIMGKVGRALGLRLGGVL